jgi:hypothetical protein
MDGFAWRSESCPDYQGFNPCAEQTEGPPSSGGEIHYHVPVAYRVLDECSTMSGRFDDDRVRRMAEAIASFVIARELWTGDLSKLDPYDSPAGAAQVNGHLASAGANVLPATTDPWAAVATLEAATGEDTRGGRVFIHASPAVVGLVADRLERVGNELRTKTGAVVIGDAGYPGTGPDGTGDGWMFATGPVAVRLGPVQTELAAASTVDRRTNSRHVWASRMFAATFDACAHNAIQVTGP